MKLLFAAYNCDPDGGSEHHVGWRWTQGMSRRGHEVHVITQAGNPAAPAIVDAGIHVHMPTRRLPHALIHSHRGAYAAYWHWQRATLDLARTLDHCEDFDLVHHVSWGSLFWWTPLWKIGKPTVVGPIGGAQVSDPAFSRFFGGAWTYERARTTLVRYVFPRRRAVRSSLAHCVVVAANTETRRLVESVGGTVVATMPDTAVRKKFFVSDKWASEREPTILWVGRALPRKGLRLAIDVFSEVRKRVPRARLVVAGNGPTIRADVDHAATLGVADGVDWLGWVDDQELCRLYRTSRLMLFSSLRDTLGSQVFEAMAGALPIVALDRGGVHDFVPAAAGAKVSASTPDELVSRLSKECISLLEDGERWHKASIAASEAAEQFTENRALEAMELIYSQALATKDVT